MRTAVLFLLLIVAPVAHAERISPVEGLEMARRAFAGMNDFIAEITQEKQIALLRKKLVSTGTVRFRRPDSFLMEMNPPHASRMLLKDNVLTVLLPAENVRQKTVLPAEEGLLRWFGMLDKPITKLPEGLDVRADRAGENVTLTFLPTAKRGVREIQLTLQEDGRPRRIVIEEQNRDRTVMTFRNVRKNVGLSGNVFRID